MFHVSYTIKEDVTILRPRNGRIDNQNDPQELIPFIAVCPTINQCIVAIGDWFDLGTLIVYETCSPSAMKADWVFDYLITNEHRFYQSTKFNKIGCFDTKKFSGLIPKRLRDISKIGNLVETLQILNR